jgi:hypothetical protein
MNRVDLKRADAAGQFAEPVHLFVQDRDGTVTFDALHKIALVGNG